MRNLVYAIRRYSKAFASMPPETRYTRSGDIRIAHQVVGDGPFDLVYIPGFVTNLEHAWDNPALARFLTRLASFSRLILFDKRGTGLSDRVARLPTLEERMDDVRAVMDAVGSVRAALFGISEGAAMAMLFAATYPDRTRALLLFGAYGHFNSWVLPPEKLEEFIELVDRSWGTGESLRSFAPTKMSDEHFRQMWARCERLGGSPSAVIALMRMNSEIDIRHILPLIRVPTLVLHRVGDSRVNVAAGRYLAQHIPEAKYVELPGVDHLITVGDTDRIADEIEEFLTGTRSDFEADRVLATVLFTDIVDSTRHAAELGDQKWRVLLDQHDNLIRQGIVRFQGREIKTLGDGFLATFDGPARAVRCARQIGETVKSLGIDLRSGIHTGEIETKGDDIGGLAVHIAARVAALAAPGEVFVSSTVKDLVAGSGLRFRDCGSRTIKGLSQKIRIFTADADGAGA